MLKVLYVSPEAVPFVKTGGLADVAFSLPKHLRKLGIDIRVIIPEYKEIPKEFKAEMKSYGKHTVNLAWRKQDYEIHYLEYEGIPFYFIDNEYYFGRDELYGFEDDGERFSFFCEVIINSIQHLDFIPDIIHCNDWHCGMICSMLDEYGRKNVEFSRIKTIFTIHNLRYKGVFPMELLEEVLGLDMEYFYEDDFNFYDDLSFMRSGINYSDLITTVSKTYVREIQTNFFGEGLDELLRLKSRKLWGVVSGIDYELYNPRSDNYIYSTYDLKSLKKKKKNKTNLQQELNLKKDAYIPMIGIVTRLVDMKGIGLIIERFDELLSEDLQIVVLGTGNENLESKLKDFEKKYPYKLSVNIAFDEALAHKIYAASDMFLMHSLFEPCGLPQLIAMRYGTIPIVRETRGLKDTVKSFNEATREGNGFSFTEFDSNYMLCSIKKAIGLYKDKSIWKKIIKKAMSGDYSWEKSANEYTDIYKELVT